MSRYFFHHHENGQFIEDLNGTKFDTMNEVRMAAMRTLPAIAKDEIAKDGDRQAYSVFVTDAEGKPVYSATLTFAGLWLNGE